MTERSTHPGLSHHGRTAFVTGGGSGIGLETALTLADLGADVAVLDWTPGAAAAAAERIEKIGRRALAIEGDTGDEQTVVDASRRRGARWAISTRPSPAPACWARAARCSKPRSRISSRSWASMCAGPFS